MLLQAKPTLGFLTARQRGPGEYVETAEREPTMEALRWAAEISSILAGPPIEPAPFIGQCRRPGGTFAMTAAGPEASRAASYYAVRVLTLCGQLSRIPPDLPHWFVGEIARPGQPAATDIDEMFYVLRALQQVGALGLIAPDVARALVDFIQRCRTADGGYAGLPGQPPDTEHTYCAVCSLALLGQPVSETDGAITARWLRSRFATPSGLAALTAADASPSLAATYWGFRAGEVLSAAVWPQRLGAAVESLRQPDGGYGTRAHATLWESYCALRVMSSLPAADGAGQ